MKKLKLMATFACIFLRAKERNNLLINHKFMQREDSVPAAPFSTGRSSVRVAWGPWRPDSDLSRSNSSWFVIDGAWNWCAYASSAGSGAPVPGSPRTRRTRPATPSTRTAPWDAVVLQRRRPLESFSFLSPFQFRVQPSTSRARRAIEETTLGNASHFKFNPFFICKPQNQKKSIKNIKFVKFREIECETLKEIAKLWRNSKL